MKMRIGLAQFNPTLGALEENTDKILEIAKISKSIGVQILAFPELAITGYPPEDLLFRNEFLQDVSSALQKLSSELPSDMITVLGFVRFDSAGIYNSAAIIYNNQIIGTYDKTFLPNYGVFDEFRYFTEGREPLSIKLGGLRIGITICEDIWYPEGPSRWLAALSNAHLILTLNASPFEIGKPEIREEMIKVRARDSKTFIAYVNLVGAQDELIFDGHSFIVSPDGEVIARAPGFRESLLVGDLDMSNITHIRRFFPHPIEKRRIVQLYEARYSPHEVELGEPVPSPETTTASNELPIEVLENQVLPLEKGIAQVYSALVLGVRDYFRKTGFKKAVIGVSGGIDSALVACISADALGSENVIGVIMPSRYTSRESLEDANQLLDNLKVRKITIGIDKIFNEFLNSLNDTFRGLEPDITEQNLQARIRGNLLMAIANKFKALVIATSNKSESSVGYATLYGDTCGAIAPLKDVYKTTVYKLAKYRNSISPVIPERILVKPPSAELKPDQRDEDELMPYKILDEILKRFIEGGEDLKQIVAKGLPKAEAQRAIKLLLMNEYKRRQSPPGFKVSPKAFGKDWRYPIINAWRPKV